jgi:hypothetical protein
MTTSNGVSQVYINADLMSKSGCINAHVGNNYTIQIAAALPLSTIINPPENKRTYSSVWNQNHVQSMLDSPQAWSAGANTGGQWMQIDLSSSQTIVGIVMQGRHDADQHVKSVNIMVSNDEVAWTDEGTYDTANATYDSQQQIKFPSPPHARYVRINVLAWSTHISMRAAVLGVGSASFKFQSPPLEENSAYKIEVSSGRLNAAASPAFSWTGTNPGQGPGVVLGDTSSGVLVADEMCLTDGIGSYANSASATITALYSGLLEVRGTFRTESTAYDYLTIQGMKYGGTTPPGSLSLTTGETFTWKSDSSITEEGFTICLLPSEGNIATFNVNGMAVPITAGRGFNIVVLDPISFAVIDAVTFDTHGSVDAAPQMIEFIANIAEDNIVLAAVKDDAQRRMSTAAWTSLGTIGSSISTMGYRSSLAIIGKKGSKSGTAVELYRGVYEGVATVSSAVMPWHSRLTSEFRLLTEEQ